MISPELPLIEATPMKWVETVLEGFDEFLLDHAACERKASALAMSLVIKYSDRKMLIEPMVCLAREELDHFHQVYKIITKRGLNLGSKDVKDFYVNDIISQLRHGREERFLDRLVTSGIIEARGYERFSLIAKHIEDEDLKIFYQKIADSEVGHYKVFTKIASKYFSAEEVDEAVKRIAEIESKAMLAAPIRPTMH